MTKPKTISIKKFERALSERSFEVISFYVCASKIVFVEVKTKLLRHLFLYVPQSYSFLIPPKTTAKIVNISLFDETYSSLSLPFLEKSPNFSKVDFVTVTGRMITHYGEEIIRWTFDNPETEVASESEDAYDLLIDLDSSSTDEEEIDEEILEEEDEEDFDLDEEEGEEEDSTENSESGGNRKTSSSENSSEENSSKSEKKSEEKPKEDSSKPKEEIAKPKEEKSSKPKEEKSVEKTPSEVGENKESKPPEKPVEVDSDGSSEESSSEEVQREEIVLKETKKETRMQPIVAKFAKKEVPKPYPTPIPSKIAETDVEIGALYPCYRLSTFLRIDKAVLEDTIFQVIEDVKDIELDSRIQRFLEIKELYSKAIKKLEDVLATAQKDEKAFFINFRKLGTLLSKSKDQSIEEKVQKLAEEMNMEAIENREKVETSLYNFLAIGKLLLEE